MLNVLNPITQAITALYGAAVAINEFLDKHIAELKQSDNKTIKATGTVLEGAKFGFGLGYITPIVITVVGQLMLGAPLTAHLGAAGTITSGALLTNPVAMTCGSIGAIYFGWKALSEEERDNILNIIAEAYEIGKELIKAMIHYVLVNLKELLSDENLKELKVYVTEIANKFGKTLYDVSKAVKDKLSEVITTVSDGIGEVSDKVKEKFSKA